MCGQLKRGQIYFLWCYKPAKVVLDNGKEISWSIEATRDLRLPNPELLAEFHWHTGGEGILFATIQQVVETLSSTEHNTLEAAVLSHLAQATQSSRTPTDRVVDWIPGSEQLYQEGLRGVAYWESSPGEVDSSEFEAWCRERLKDSNIPFDKVDWGRFSSLSTCERVFDDPAMSMIGASL